MVATQIVIASTKPVVAARRGLRRWVPALATMDFVDATIDGRLHHAEGSRQMTVTS
jgi:hypothetical protein